MTDIAAIREEALALLSPSARHDNIVRLEGVVTEGSGVLKLLVFELAEEGSLNSHIERLVAADGRFVISVAVHTSFAP